jgi:hypothetical protein
MGRMPIDLTVVCDSHLVVSTFTFGFTVGITVNLPNTYCSFPGFEPYN